MLGLVLESMLRSIALGIAVWLALRLLSVRNTHTEMAAWKIVLVASLAMPFLVQLMMPWAKVTIPVQAPQLAISYPQSADIDRVISKAAQQTSEPAAVPLIVPDPPLADEIDARQKIVRAPVDWWSWATGLYYLVSGLLLLRLLFGIARAVQLKRQAQPLDDERAAGCDVRVSKVVTMPVTFASTILLPADCIHWSAVKRRAVLCHEKSHIERGDFRILLLASINRAVFWLNPLSWWLCRRLTELAEAISDDAAIEAVGDSPTYAEILLDIASNASPVAVGVGMARPRTVRQRVERILTATAPQPPMTMRKRLLLSAGLFPAVAISAITIARGTSPAEVQGVAAVQPTPVTIGFLNDLSSDQWPPVLTAFREGLGDAGYIEGQNVAFTYRWTEGRRDRLAALAADLVRSNVAVIIASGDTAAALAAQAATSKIPIIFAIEDDPIKFGLAAGIDKPGGNATGIQLLIDGSPRRDLLRQLVPNIGANFWTVTVLDASSDAWRTDPESALTRLLDGVRVRTSTGVSPEMLRLLQTEPTTALRQMQQQMGTPDDNDRVKPHTLRSLEVVSGPFLDSARRKQAIDLAARHGIPTLYHWRGFAEAGGLISYGPSLVETYSQMGRYAGEILKGGNPADMPILKPTKFETVINLRTAGELGLNVPEALIARADKVIQ